MANMIKNIIAFLFYLLLASPVMAQTASLLPQGRIQFFDNNGNPLAGGKVYNYIVGTTTFKTTWQDSGQLVANANPIILDSAGRALIYGQGAYRQIVRSANNTLIWDAVTSSTGSGSGSSTTGDGDLVGTVKPWAGLTAPNQYAFAFGQELSRTTYSTLLTAITLQTNVTCTSASNTLTAITDTSSINVGAAIEATCVPSGTTVVSKTASTVVVSNPASLSVTVSGRFFPFGNGDGSTTFNVPDLRGYVLAGRDNMGGVAASRLTTTYFGANTPDALYSSGGSQSNTIAQANLPAVSLTTTIAAGQGAHTHSATTNAGLQSTQASAGGATFMVSGTGTVTVNSATLPQMTGTTPLGGSGTAISRIQPTVTMNYIIKVTPDTNSTIATGVTDIEGMVGSIDCGTGLLCTGNVISVPNSEGTAGYALIGNGGGVAATFQGFTQSGTGATTRTWQSKVRDIINVKDFGAVCDNVTDDGPFIQAAVDAAGAAGGYTAIQLPTGCTSYINTQIVINSADNENGVYFYCEAPGACRWRISNTITSGSYPNTAVVFTGVTWGGMDGIYIAADGATPTAVLARGTYGLKFLNLTVDGVCRFLAAGATGAQHNYTTVQGMAGIGINTGCSSPLIEMINGVNLEVFDNTVTNNAVIGAATSGRSFVGGLITAPNIHDALLIRGNDTAFWDKAVNIAISGFTSVGPVWINDNIFDSSSTTGITINLSGGGACSGTCPYTNPMFIQNNWVTSYSGNVFEILGNGDTVATSINVTGNNFRNTISPAPNPGANGIAVATTGYVQDLLISNNYVYNITNGAVAGSSCIQLVGGASKYTNITITGNNLCSDNNLHVTTGNVPDYGILIQNTIDKLNITGNVIRGADYGINTQTLTNATVQSNVLTGGTAGCAFNTTLTGNMIRNNVGTSCVATTTVTPLLPPEVMSGTSAYVIGDLPYANSTTTLTRLPAVASGRVLSSAGTGTAPAYTTTPTLGASGTLGTITFGNATSGTITLTPTTGALGTRTLTMPAASGTIALTAGASIPAIATGDLLYGSAANTLSALSAVATGSVLGSQGVGTAPAWLSNVNLSGYFRAGSASAPLNTTAGDITSVRLSVGNSTTFSEGNGIYARLTGTSSDTSSGTTHGMVSGLSITPATDKSGSARSLYSSVFITTTSNIAGSINGIYTESRVVGTAGNIAAARGIDAAGLVASTGSTALGTVTTAVGGRFLSVNSVNHALTSTVSNAVGVEIINLINSGSGPLTITNQAGLNIHALSGATNNTHIMIGSAVIPSGQWGLYVATANSNYLQGSLAIGTTTVVQPLTVSGNASTSGYLRVGSNTAPISTTAGDLTVGRIAVGDASLTGRLVAVGANLTGNAISYIYRTVSTIQSDVTSIAGGYSTALSTQAAAFTLGSLRHFMAEQATIGAGSSVTSQYGFIAESSLTGATNNFGFYGNIAAAANRWNFYAAGTANNYMAGGLALGTTTFATGDKLVVSLNTSAPPAGPGTDQLVHVAQADGVVARFLQDSFGASNQFTFRRANGTNAAKTAIASGDALGIVNFLGYHTTTTPAYTTQRAAVNGVAAENWTDVAQGAYISFFTTPTGSTTIAEGVRINPSGGLSVGLTTDGGGGSILANSTITAAQYVRHGATTVGALPACVAGLQGARWMVTDSNAASFTAGIGAIVAAGGATVVPVVCDGAAWRIG